MTDIVQRLRLVDPNQVLLAPPPHDTSYLQAGLICHEAAAEIERLRVDAERYRWLRDWKEGTHDIVPMTGRYFGTPILREELDLAIDAAIDAAMKEDKS